MNNRLSVADGYCKEKMVRKEYKIFLSDSEVCQFESIVDNAFELPRKPKDQRLLQWIQNQIHFEAADEFEAISNGEDEKNKIS